MKMFGRKNRNTAARDEDRGVVVTWFAAALVSLLGMGALVVDVGALWSERRQLQNGADAAALAVAIDAADVKCAAGSCTGLYQTLAANYANANAGDGVSTVETLCGKGPGLAGCATYVPPESVGLANWLHVKLKTLRPGAASTGRAKLDEVPLLFAPVLDAARVGQTVRASATVAWGTPSSANVLPFVISKCELEPFRSESTGKLEFPNTPIRIQMHDVTKDWDRLDLDQTCDISGKKWPKGFAFTGDENDPVTKKKLGNKWVRKCEQAKVRIVSVDPDTGEYSGTVLGKGDNKKMSQACDLTMRQYIENDKPIVIPVVYSRTGKGKNIVWKFDGFVAIKVCAYDISGGGKGKSMLEVDTCNTDICDIRTDTSSPPVAPEPPLNPGPDATEEEKKLYEEQRIQYELLKKQYELDKKAYNDLQKYTKDVINGRRLCGVLTAYTVNDGDIGAPSGGPNDYLTTVIKMVG